MRLALALVIGLAACSGSGPSTPVPLTSSTPATQTAVIGPAPMPVRTFAGTPFKSYITDGGTLKSFATGPDGNLWFSIDGGLYPTPYGLADAIGKLTPGGTITYYLRLWPDDFTDIGGIVSSTDGTLWFATHSGAGHISTNGSWLTHFTLPYDSLYTIAQTRDGNYWLFVPTLEGSNGSSFQFEGFDQISESGASRYFASALGSNGAGDIINGPDGNLWMPSEQGVIKITPSGASVYYPAPSAFSNTADIRSICAGSDGNIWADGAQASGFTPAPGYAFRITTAGTYTPLTLPNGTNNDSLVCMNNQVAVFDHTAQGDIVVVDMSGNVISQVMMPAGMTASRPAALGADGNVYFAGTIINGSVTSAINVWITH